MIKLAHYLKHYKKQVIIGPFFKLLEAIFELIVPLVMASIIDIGIKNSDVPYIIRMGGIMILLGFMGLIFALICQYNASIASQGVGTMLRADLFEHINAFTYKELDKFGTNSLITRITNDVNQLQLAVAMLIRLVIRAPFLVIGSIIMAMMLDLKLSLIFIIVAPLVSVILYCVMSRSIPYYKVRQAKVDKISLITRENLEGARVIRAFSKQEQEMKRFEEANQDVTDIVIRVGKLSAILNPATFTVLNGAIIAIIWFGGKQVDLGFLAQGQIIAFVNYMTQISLALVVVANLVVIFTKASASAARINEIFDTLPSFEEGKSEIIHSFDSTTPKVSFHDVCFSYTGSDVYSLNNITFDVYTGQTIGIIGGTGSGKSTLVNLIARFYDTTKGDIQIDGVSIKEYTFEQLRGKFGIVPQKSVLFKGTIAENLRFRKENATDTELEKAVEIAQALEIIRNKPDQFDSIIEQGGKNLSGGQKQRIAIARALVGNPEILILDDSSSALDYATDAALRKAIKEQIKDTTVFIVSQRANSIKYADKIIVLDDGQMVGIGTHDDLLETCETYKEICLSQQSSEEVNRK
ncbi:ABC transporter ATP-binding protein [Candidatus Galacturonibacter soehngenii]|uniref:ABC transporter ATP-binding protein n=1 Tax=Candidatus Galacturonatibacter soehngenii TaxID=2307010 RepID=A0A7V7UD45_9FIRM|nr:ABC transporter ATP-binding protein [Candidatus Galacturonibacter soehngenii]KAB1440042.1 ABC transporter ATP-binding protein [Candidatus Galacturonibacter soehngenii]